MAKLAGASVTVVSLGKAPVDSMRTLASFLPRLLADRRRHTCRGIGRALAAVAVIDQTRDYAVILLTAGEGAMLYRRSVQTR